MKPGARLSTASDLFAVLAEGRRLADEAAATFGALSAQQVNWKPSPGEWSIGQCFDHLIISNRPYVPIIESARGGRMRRRAWERVPWLPRLFASLLIATLQPDSRRKAKARPAFYPSNSEIAPEIVSTFAAQQDRLLRLMHDTRGLDLAGIIITSPVSRLVTYSLIDAYRIIVVHEQNHVAQARQVLESPGFPAAPPGSDA